MSLLDDFGHVEDIKDPQARGYKLEGLIGRLFERHDFRVTRSPKSARPRQTDLHARRGSEEYLIEVKWRSKPASIDDIDSFRRRLESVQGHIIGIFFSMSGYTKTAISDVENRRHRGLLLFNSDETRSLFAESLHLISVLREKKESYSRDGITRFMRGSRRWFDRPLPDLSLLPKVETRIWCPQRPMQATFVGGGNFPSIVFALEIPDVDWTISPGMGVSLTLHANLDKPWDMAHVIDALRTTVGISGRGSFTIAQASSVWAGFGAREFLDALVMQEERYKNAGYLSSIHHSEEVRYFDVSRDGLTSLYAKSSARRPEISAFDISMQLYGVPVDTTPYQNLVEQLGINSFVYFRPLPERSVKSIRFFGEDPIQLSPIAYLLEHDQEDWISGVIVKNPFRRDADRESLRADGIGEFYSYLLDVEFLICTLIDYHGIEDIFPYYHLHKVEWTETASMIVIRVFAAWPYDVKRPEGWLRDPQRKL